MNEKELNEILSSCESVATGIVRLTDNLDVTKAIGGTLITLVGVNARIAYELTRIADAKEQNANPIIHVDKDGYVQPTPAPDAPAGVPDGTLVEAVEKYLATITLSPSDRCCFTLHDLRAALAAREKAVRDGT